MGGMCVMTKFLVKCRNIEIGDILFASSIAKKLKEQHLGCVVDYDINYLQPLELLQNNPYIDNVYFKENHGPYDDIFIIMEGFGTINPYKSAVSQFQQIANIKNFDDTFEIFTTNILDYSIKKSMHELVKINYWEDKPIKVCYVMDWDRKSFLFTEEEYSRASGGEDGTGYGTGRRKVNDIIKPLINNTEVILFAIGIESKDSKNFPSINSSSKFTFTASLIKNSDYVIGPEGCLTNMSSALGVKTIITTDYIHQMFGPKGIHWQQTGGNTNELETRIPFLGPNRYFPDECHIHLSPYLTDEEVGQTILEEITHGR